MVAGRPSSGLCGHAVAASRFPRRAVDFGCAKGYAEDIFVVAVLFLSKNNSSWCRNMQQNEKCTCEYYVTRGIAKHLYT